MRKEAYDELKKLLAEVDSDLLQAIRITQHEEREGLLHQLDALTKLEERLYAHRD
jgi:uncharacterized protein YjgD (DUF1641 family)